MNWRCEHSIGGGFHKAAEHFRNRPGLRDATARSVGRLGVENFANRANARLSEVIAEPVQEASRLMTIVGINFQPGVDKGSDKPCPNRALMIGCIARAEVAIVAGVEIFAAGASDASPWASGAVLSLS